MIKATCGRLTGIGESLAVKNLNDCMQNLIAGVVLAVKILSLGVGSWSVGCLGTPNCKD